MVDLTLADQRAAGEHAEDLTAEPDGVLWEEIRDAPVRGLWAIPEGEDGARAILYLFGGGHVITSIHARRKFGGHVARAAGCRVMIADYRLAPEHPFPADVEDATAAYRWLRALGTYRAVAIGGESSAAGLTMSTLFALHESSETLPGAAFLLSPWLDLTCTGETHMTQRDVDLTCTRESLERMARQYLGGHDPHDPRVSALDADLSGLPPLFVQAGGYEILLDDAVRVVRRAGMQGTPATLEIWPEMQHFFQACVGAFPEAEAALTSLGRWLRDLQA
jgi:acetyl esterase/lipase